ncbi:MAG: tetratricopeptide repeat protein [Planctomycetaceae bacterium]|jgi:tetratricopeptide (TPR) repeat protein|nr:tetratricopeptide repeat protein [Planctomycetaceae bacterium]
MARIRDDEDEKIVPVVKKRRRPQKQPVTDDEENTKNNSKKKNDDNEESEDEDSISTGNVVLDIILDFRDDCVDWVKEHFVIALVIGIVASLLFLISLGLAIRYFINYINRPTLELTLTVYDLGSYAEAKRMAEEVLKYTPPSDVSTRTGVLFILGASTCFMAENAWETDRKPYYLAAANYLRDSGTYGFIPERRAEGFFLLGKSLYLSGELTQCREPLQQALELDSPNKKWIYWFLAHSYFLESNPDFRESLRYLQSFQNDPATTKDEQDEANFLRSMILIQLGNVNAAEQVLEKIPQLDRFRTIRQFVLGQIDFMRARELRQKSIDLENQRNPVLLNQNPIAPAPVRPTTTTPTTPTPNVETPTPTTPEPSVLPPVVPLKNQMNEHPANPADMENLLPNGSTNRTQQFPNSSVSAVAPVPVTPVEPVQPPQPDHPWSAVIPPVPINDFSNENFTNEHLNSQNLTGQNLTGQNLTNQNSFGENQETTLAHRINSIRSRISERYAQEVSGANIAPAPPILLAQMVGTTTDSEEKIIVLPTETKEEQAPFPSEFPAGSLKTQAQLDSIQVTAKKLQEDAAKKYREAIEHFQEVRRLALPNVRWVRTAELLQGICYDEMGDLAKAQEIYLKITETFPKSSEAAAADFLWAEIERKFGRTETSLRGFARTFETIRQEPNYTCFWLSKDAILERCREIIHNNIQVKEYKEAATLLYLLRGVMKVAELARFRGNTYESWAVHLRQQADATLGPEGEKLLRESYTKYRRSGEAFAELSQVDYESTDFSDWLWRSAENFRLGKDYRRAIPQYKNFLRITINEHRPEIYLYLGEMYLHIDALDAAAEILEEALKYYPNHALVPRIRITLSRAYIEKKEWEKAQEILQQNLIDEYAPSSAVYRDSMFALGKLFYERGHFSEAVPYLEDAVRNYPNAVQTADSHYYLSRAYLQQATEFSRSAEESILEAVRRQLLTNADIEREKALIHIQKTEEILVKRQEAMDLTESEQLMLRNILFESGSVLMELKRYEQAISALSIVATRYQNQPESLDALIRMATAYRQIGKSEEAATTLNQAEFVLNRLEKNGTIPQDSNWKKLIQAEKNLQ